MKKRLMTAALMLSVMLAACGQGKAQASTAAAAESSAETETRESDDILTGGWSANQGSLLPEDNADAMKAFTVAVEGMTGYKYEVLAVLGSQPVAGTNYAYLCKGTAVVPNATSAYLLVDVYADLDGKAELRGTKELLPAAAAGMTAEWKYNSGDSDPQANPAVQEVFAAALTGKVGSVYEPIAYIGGAGEPENSYTLLCGNRVVPNADRSFCLLTVQKKADGSAEVLDTEKLELGTELPSATEEQKK
ncbi:hypothetical protein [Stomatobaculum longum]|uniref:hypothetical protein n=1 Tax=Stomatobaculum longum TaxID=796942 RepID=UPI0028E4A296|nr:hypothetical protein [Stomatobaculum longum]